MKSFTVTVAIAALISSISLWANEKPNIIIFYVDDLGWQDVEKINDVDKPCPYETPNLIELAERGMNFPQGYSPAPTCAPSRAAILTGLHPAFTNYTHVTAAAIPDQKPDNEFQEPFLGSYFDLSHPTLADVLKKNGYTTGHTGKWHAGLNASAYGFDFVNQTRGFHRGMKDRTKDFSTPKTKGYALSKEKYPPISDDKPEGISYPYDELTDASLKFIQENKDQPFFLNMCHWMVHWPMLTRNGELLEYYCKKMGYPFPLKPGDMKEEGQRNPYFGAMVTSVDWSLGRIMHLLKTTDDPRQPGKKLIDTTYLIFTSDNGGALIKGREILSDNAPLKNGKKRVDEGGIRVPMVISGPNIAHGSKSSELINQLDFFPTILSLTSSTFNEKDAANLSGLDLSPLLHGKSTEVLDQNGTKRESLFWHFPHNGMKAAIRKGDFKLYRNFTSNNYSLYRLYQDGKRADLEEIKNLIDDETYTAIKEELITELNGNLKANDAEIPYRNPKFKGAKLPSAKITSTSFAENKAQAVLSSESTKATRAFALYYPVPNKDGKKGKKNTNYSKADPEVGYQVKIPATISVDGYTVSVDVPEKVGSVRFIVIDANNYCHFSELVTQK